MNSVILTGRLVRDPELKTFEGGANNSNLCSFTLAVDMTKDKTVFVPCSVYGDRGDLIAKTLRKGNLIAIQGKLDQRVFETQTGEKKTVTFVKVDTFDYLEKRKDEIAIDTGETTKITMEDLLKQKSFTTDDVENLDLPDDDLPF